MDIFTHAVLPMAVVLLWLRRPRAQALAAGLGAAMPDVDFFLSWATRLGDPFYAFTHRGWSHTLWGAPLLALLGLAVLSRPWWARRWGRMEAFQLGRWAAMAAVGGAWSHLALDMLTITGVPLLWPLSAERFTLNVFFFSALYMVPVSAYLVWRLAKGTLGDELLRRGTALLVIAMVLGGGLRLATMPRDLPEGAVVQPTPTEVRWVVAVPVEQGWEVRDHGLFVGSERSAFRGNASSEAQEAVARAQALGSYTGWRWGNPTPVVNATPIEGGWRVEFRDAVAMHRNLTGGFIAGLVRVPVPLVVEVTQEGARVVLRPGGFGLGG